MLFIWSSEMTEMSDGRFKVLGGDVGSSEVTTWQGSKG